MSRRIGRLRQVYVLGIVSFAFGCLLLFLHSTYDLSTVPLLLPAALNRQGTQTQWSSKERILLTGGMGNVGTTMLPRLTGNYEVTVLDLAPIPSDYPLDDHTTYVNGDIRDTKLVASLLTPDVVGVINLAAVSRVLPCLQDVAGCWDVNTNGTRSILDAMRISGSSAWIVHTSSREVYGSVGNEPVVEESPKNPVNEYGRSKLASELEVIAAVAKSPLRAIIVRLSSVYGGPRDIPDRLVPNFVRAGLADQPLQIVGGNQDLDLLYIEDCVDGFMGAVNKLEKLRTQSFASWRSRYYLDDFNLMSGENTLASDLIDKVIRYTASASPVQKIVSDDRFPARFAGVPDKAVTGLGYRAKVTIDEGIQRMVEHHRTTFLRYAENYLEEHCTESSIEDYQNSQLERLDGCQVNLGVDVDGVLFQLKARGDRLEADGKLGHYEHHDWAWDAIGLNVQYRGDHVIFDHNSWGMFINGSELWVAPPPAGSRFRIQLHPGEAAFRLIDVHLNKMLVAENRGGKAYYLLQDPTPDAPYNWRMSPVCCPRPGPWPFMKDDFLEPDIRWGNSSSIPFVSSNRYYRCREVRAAVERPFEHSPPPVMGHIQEWSQRDLPPCRNDCDNPLVCVKTGKCRCVVADHCKRPVSLSIATKIPEPASELPVRVAATDFRTVLLPAARQQLMSVPNQLKVHVVTGYKGEEESEAAKCHHLEQLNCMSADAVLYRAMRTVSVPAEEADIIVYPIYEACGPVLVDEIVEAAKYLPKKPTAFALVSDWGMCWHFDWQIWEKRDNLVASPITPLLNTSILWSVMGDYDSPCARPQQDVVIPARTCVTPHLLNAFSDVANIRHVRDRKTLVSFKGSGWGTGRVTRFRLTCGGRDDSGETIWDWNWEQYMDVLNDSKFCALPRGTTGWATRTSDVIYAGCIPVLLAEGTHYPFADMIDWTKISVRIDPTDLDSLEDILRAIPLKDLETLQSNLMLVRDAFMYSGDEHPEDELARRGPLFYTLHSTAMRLTTTYPVG